MVGAAHEAVDIHVTQSNAVKLSQHSASRHVCCDDLFLRQLVRLRNNNQFNTASVLY